MQRHAGTAGTRAFRLGTCVSPAGLPRIPVGTYAFPVGTRAFRVGTCTFPLGMWCFQVGTRRFPVGIRCFRLGICRFRVVLSTFSECLLRLNLFESSQLNQNLGFPAVFDGIPSPAARRAKENSPAIHRWVRSPCRSKSRRDDRTLGGYRFGASHLSIVPAGLRRGYGVPTQR